jgi:hypothetical protein
MIRDRGPNFTAAFDVVGVRTVLRKRPDAPHERDRRTLDRGCRHELLDRTRIWNQAHLQRILRQYETHHNRHRRFYVAVTRAIDVVVLIPGTHFTAWGNTYRTRWSQFITDIQREIGPAPSP